MEKIRGGGLRQKPSGVIFPGKVALFVNQGSKQYDEKGLDLGVKYHLDHFIIADVYCYPAGAARNAFDREFAHQQSDIRTVNQKVKLLSQSAISVQQSGRTITGRQATYNLERPLFGATTNKAESVFILFRDGQWFFAYRFSYPRERAAIASQHVKNFVNAWSWRGR